MPTVYRYCKEDEFNLTLQNKELWLSDSRCLNDYMEHKLLLDIAHEILDERLTNRHGIVFAGCSKMQEIIEGNERNPYVCCFSQNPNSLPQWIAYADRACGFAVGFDSFKLCDALRPRLTVKRSWGGEVIYEYDEQVALLTKVIYEYLLEVADTCDISKVGTGYFWPTVNRHFDDIWKIAALAKSKDFEWEKEWRLVAMPEHDFESRKLEMGPFELLERNAKDGSTIPYFKLPFDVVAIKEVHITRNNRYWDKCDELDNFLQSHGVTATIVKCPITFRV